MTFHDKTTDKPNTSPASLPTAEEKRPSVVRRSRFRRFLRWALLPLGVGLVLLALISGYYYAQHWAAVNRLEEATAEMDAQHPGFRIEELEAARANIPDEENGALIALAAMKLLPQGQPSPDIPGSEVLAPSAESPPYKHLNELQRESLADELESLHPALVEARKLVHYSTGRYPLVYQRNIIATPVPHTQNLRGVHLLLIRDAILRMDEGDFHEAAISCQAAINAGRSLGDEPVGVSQLVRVACVNIAGRTIERLLAQGVQDDKDLAALQGMLESEMKHPGLLLSYCGLRAGAHRSFEVMASGEFVHDLSVERLRPPTWSEYYTSFRERDALRVQHAEAFPLMNKLVEIGETPAHLRAKPLEEFRAMIQALRMNWAAPFLAGQDDAERSFTRSECWMACVAIALAAERFRIERGDWPTSLEALAPKFLRTVPLDPCSAQPLGYLRLNDGVVIYSLYPDGKGQAFDPKAPSPPGEGVAVRLWDVKERGKE
jgi:hypothetical protein